MSGYEKMNNQPGASDNAFADMAEQVPSFEEHMQQYEAEHPDAIKDIDQARAVAEAGDKVRNEAMLRNNLELAIQNGDSDGENKIINQLADSKVEDLMDSLKDFPDETAFQRVQISILTALYKTRIGKKLNHMSMVRETKHEARNYNQSDWAQSLLEDADKIEKEYESEF